MDEAINLVSSPSSSNYLEVIEELGFKNQHFLAHSGLPPIFMEYRPVPVIDNFWEKMGCNKKPIKVGMNLWLNQLKEHNPMLVRT